MVWGGRGNPNHAYWAQLYKGTQAELSLEAAVATLGVPYRTNFPCYNFLPKVDAFPDFLLPTLGLVIEVDGKEHFEPTRMREDEARSLTLERVHGWTVVRVTNEDAIKNPADCLDRALAEAGINMKTDRSRLGPSVKEFLPKTRRNGKVS